MGLGRRLTDYERGQIDALKAQGKSNREIARNIHRSPKVINNYLGDRQGYGQLKSTGRPRVLTARDERAILRNVPTEAVSIGSIAKAAGVRCSRSTVWRFLNQSPNVEYTEGKEKPAWTSEHIQARNEFAIRHVTWTLQWDNVIFSDEKKWNLDGPDGSHYYWHDIRSEQRTFKKRVQGGGSVMTWGAFGANGKKTNLIIVDGRLDSEGYQHMLEHALLPVAEQIAGSSWIFQQDNAPVHVSQSTRRWFERNGARILDWPSLSPDLNPMENLWGIMVRRVYANGRQFNRREQLINALQEIWNSIDAETTRHLIDSMHNRCIKLIQAKGDLIGY